MLARRTYEPPRVVDTIDWDEPVGGVENLRYVDGQLCYFWQGKWRPYKPNDERLTKAIPWL